MIVETSGNDPRHITDSLSKEKENSEDIENLHENNKNLIPDSTEWILIEKMVEEE